MDELLSVQAAAARLGGLSKWTLYAWLSQGKLTRVKIGGRTMIRASDLERIPQVGAKSPAPRRRDWQ
jgi:excisionase family DNA binding protein